jgi:hypothetical protein
LPADKPRFYGPLLLNLLPGWATRQLLNFDLLASSTPPDTEAERQAYQRWVHGHKVMGWLLTVFDCRIGAQYLLSGELSLCHFGASLIHLIMPLSGRRVSLVCGFDWSFGSLGHRRIAYIGASSFKIQVDRFRGYQDGCKPQAGFRTRLGRRRRPDSEGATAATQLLSLPDSTAITCIDDMTLSVSCMRTRAGLAGGAKLAVTGFDGIEV